MIRQVVIPTLTSPLVMAVLMGILVNISGVPLPEVAIAVLQSVGASYSSLALFCLGFSLWQDDDDSQQQQQQDSLPEQQEQQLQRLREGSKFGWVQPALLVAAKSVLLPVLARIIVLRTTGSGEYSRFAFVCTTFPASPAIALFAAQFGLPIADVRRISVTTIVGTIASAFIVLATAEMVMADGSAAKRTAVLQTAEKVGWGALAGSVWGLAVASSMLFSRTTPGWRRQYLVWSVFFLAFSQVVQLTLTAVCTPENFRLHHPAAAEHCTLTIEAFSTGARIWGVILLIADVHRTHRHVATSIIWRALRAGKSIVLWSAWLIPGLWAIGLWASGLRGELQLSCFSCFNGEGSSRATDSYRLLSSLLATVLATIAVGVLVWAQTRRDGQERQLEERLTPGEPLDDDNSAMFNANGGATLPLDHIPEAQRRQLEHALQSYGRRDPRYQQLVQRLQGPGILPTVAAAAAQGSDYSQPGRHVSVHAPIWLSIQIRVVGLCNLLGLFFQIAVGLSTLLSRTDRRLAGQGSFGEVSLEILALNRAHRLNHHRPVARCILHLAVYYLLSIKQCHLTMMITPAGCCTAVDLGLFAQGLGTGLILGSLPQAPAVLLVKEIWRWCHKQWNRVLAMYEDPLREDGPHFRATLSSLM